MIRSTSSSLLLMTDVANHLNILNTKLQGKNQNISYFVESITDVHKNLLAELFVSPLFCVLEKHG